MRQAALVALYLAAIVAANLSVTHFGPSSTVVNAFLFIGLDLTTRDRLHDLWGKARWPKMAGLIAAGSLLSYLVNRDSGRIALASLVAFACAGVADALVYHRLRRRPWFDRANGSNVVSAAVDSLVFPTLAFGALLWLIVLGQFTAKVAGGLLWSWVLRHRQGAREVVHRFRVEALCPADGSVDVYDATVTLEDGRLLPVEEILEVANLFRGHMIWQEDLASELSEHLDAPVDLVGTHSGVLTAVAATA